MTVGANILIQYTERMVGENHATYDDTLNRAFVIDHEQDGHHQWCHLHENVAQTTGVDEFLLFVKNDGTQTELYGRSESNGTEFQITKSDKLNALQTTDINTLSKLNTIVADATLIQATDVTYENLNTNGDVGTGATQVAQGDHAHAAYINKDGTVALTAAWDAGSFKITAETFESDIAIGTAPFTVTSTTVVPNLNVDQVDGKDSTDFVLCDGTQALTADWDVGAFKVTAGTLESGGAITGVQGTLNKLNLGGGITNFVLNGVTLGTVVGASSEIATELHYVALQHSNTAVAGSRFMFSRSRGTQATPLIIQENDSLAALDAAGFDGTDYVLAGQIDFEVDGPPAGNDMPGRIVFKTTSDGGILPTERMRIDSLGNMAINTTTVDATAAKSLTMLNGTSPAAGTANQFYLYAEDIAGVAGAAGPAFVDELYNKYRFGNGALYVPETTTPTAIADHGAFYTKSDNYAYFQDGAGVEHALITASDVTYENLSANGDIGTGAAQVSQGDHAHAEYINKDGTVALTANWDAGGFEIRAQTFESDVVTGTSPFTIASTTVVANLNVDQVDGKDSTDFVLCDGSQALTSAWNVADNIIQRPELKDYSETLGTITGDSTPTIDLESGNVWDVTITNAETTFTFSNPSASGKACSFDIILRQNATAQTINWPATVDWGDAGAPDLSVNSGIYILTFLTVDGTDSVPVFFGMLAYSKTS